MADGGPEQDRLNPQIGRKQGFRDAHNRLTVSRLIERTVNRSSRRRKSYQPLLLALGYDVELRDCPRLPLEGPCLFSSTAI